MARTCAPGRVDQPTLRGYVMNLELLKQPFPTNQIKNRQTSIGMTVAYLETPTVINRLNDVFNGEWSFKIIEHKFLDDDVASNKLEKKFQRSFNNVQSADIGWQTGNGKKLSFSQAQLGRATCLAVA